MDIFWNQFQQDFLEKKPNSDLYIYAKYVNLPHICVCVKFQENTGSVEPIIRYFLCNTGEDILKAPPQSIESLTSVSTIPPMMYHLAGVTYRRIQQWRQQEFMLSDILKNNTEFVTVAKFKDFT